MVTSKPTRFRFISGVCVALLLALGLAAPAHAANELTLVSNPIYAPDLADPNSCSQSTVELTFANGDKFVPGNGASIQFGYEEGPLQLNSAKQAPGEAGIRTAVASNYELFDPSRMALNLELCTGHLSGEIPAYLSVLVTLFNGDGTLKSSAKDYMQVLPRDEVGEAVEKLRVDCQIGQYSGLSGVKFDSNLTVSQVGLPGAKGGRVTIEGTLFRQGLAAPADQVIFWLLNAKGVKSKILARITTSDRGDFKVSFSVPKFYKKTYTVVEALVSERAKPIGHLATAFKGAKFQLLFDWDQRGAYRAGSQDWVPATEGTCANSYVNYVTQFVNYRNDDSLPAFMAFAGITLKGIDGKKSYSSLVAKNGPAVTGPRRVPTSESNSSWSGSTSFGKRCWVTGYTRKSGTRVSGYYRSC